MLEQTVERDVVPVLPGGYGRSNYVVGDRPPVPVSRGDGFLLTMEDGHQVIDLNNNFTALLHGHAQPSIVEAASGALSLGASFGLPNRQELAHAGALLERIPWAEQVRHTNSGTEAVMTAVRVARASTGRDKVVIQRPTYHGTSSTVLPALSEAGARGVPASVAAQLIPIGVGDASALEQAFSEHGDQIAAVLVDLMPTRGGLNPVGQEFASLCRELCDAHGSFLILDEVISLRLTHSGFGTHYGVSPDLLVAGKMIGGGLPIGAVVGTERSMRVLNPLQADAIPHGGTFSGNPVSLTAGVAALKLATPSEIERINRLGDRLRARLEGPASAQGWQVNGLGSLLNLLPAEGARGSLHALWHAAFGRGVFITPGTGLIAVSTPMDESVIDTVAERLLESLAETAAG